MLRKSCPFAQTFPLSSSLDSDPSSPFSLPSAGPGAVHDGGNAASRAAAGLCLWAALLARLLLDF